MVEPTSIWSPDEGNSGLGLLHDRLHTGILAPLRRLDVPFIPHMTVGSTRSPEAAKVLCDDLNAKGPLLPGSIEALTVGALEHGRIRDLAIFPLECCA